MDKDKLLQAIPPENSALRLLWEIVNLALKPFGLALIGETEFLAKSGWSKPHYRIGKRFD